MTFRSACLLTSIVWGVLFFTLLLLPGLLYWLFQIDGSASAAFLARRAAMLFLGLTAIIYFARNIEDAQSQRAISVGVVTGMGGLAVLGFYEYLRGFAGIGIWLAIVVELGFVVIFMQYLRRGPLFSGR